MSKSKGGYKKYKFVKTYEPSQALKDDLRADKLIKRKLFRQAKRLEAIQKAKEVLPKT